MKIIILLNEVNFEGVGDFSHFLDIHHALTTNPRLNDYKFISLIHTSNYTLTSGHNRYEEVKKQLDELNLPDCILFTSYNPDILFNQHPELPHYLAAAEQVIQISCAVFPACVWVKQCNPNAILKFIGEHECLAPRTALRYQTKVRSLGLSKGCHGLKLQKLDRLAPEAALALIQQSDEKFVATLLKQTHSVSIEEFSSKHLLIPAYFNGVSRLLKLLLFIAINEHFPQNRHAALYVSGLGNEKAIAEFLAEYKKIQHLFAESDVKQIEIRQASANEAIILLVNEKGTRILHLFTGFYMSAQSYTALYQQALLTGVSGDNTVEKSISAQALPFYLSTNDALADKNKTRYALSDIIDQLDIPEKTRSDLSVFFRYLCSFVDTSNFYLEKHDDTYLHIFKELNLSEMIRYWPVVANHLIEQHNFYDHLEAFFLKQAKPGKHRVGFFDKKEDEKADEIVTKIEDEQPVEHCRMA